MPFRILKRAIKEKKGNLRGERARETDLGNREWWIWPISSSTFYLVSRTSKKNSHATRHERNLRHARTHSRTLPGSENSCPRWFQFFHSFFNSLQWSILIFRGIATRRSRVSYIWLINYLFLIILLLVFYILYVAANWTNEMRINICSVTIDLIVCLFYIFA